MKERKKRKSFVIPIMCELNTDACLMHYIFQNAFAKGEVFIGHRDAGYNVSMGAALEGDRGSGSQNSNLSFCFTLHTPDRDFVMRAETQDDMEKWILSLQKVVELPLTTQDSKCKLISPLV